MGIFWRNLGRGREIEIASESTFASNLTSGTKDLQGKKGESGCEKDSPREKC